MVAIRNLKKLVIDRSRWIEGALKTMRDRRQDDGTVVCEPNFCMMGFIGEVYGTEHYASQTGSGDFADVGIPQWIKDEEQNIVGYNDSGRREWPLREIFKRHGCELEFVDKADKPVDAVFEDDPPKVEEPPVAPRALKLADLEDSAAEPFKKAKTKAKAAHG